eukprot:GHVS01001878.1.p1 GENE.GHVS01001878.1~~GHVS01001878.1.p1  ORF type:complete len:281 (-),score=44.51 GHVS01001878.1:48-791(-)
MGSTALGCLSFWAHPTSLLQLGLPAVSAAAPLSGLLSGGTERMLEVLGDDSTVFLVMDADEKAAMEKDKGAKFQEDNTFISGRTSYTLKFIDSDANTWNNIGEVVKNGQKYWQKYRVIVATDKDEIVSAAMQRAMTAMSRYQSIWSRLIFNPVLLTDKGTLPSHKHFWEVPLTKMFTAEDNKLALKKECWQTYFTAETAEYRPLALVIEYEDDGQIVTDEDLGDVVELEKATLKELREDCMCSDGVE